MPNFEHSQATADRLIRRWGKGSQAWLSRNGVLRPCYAARAEYSPRERGLFLDGSERFFISALGLAIAPEHELDLLRFQGKGQPIVEYKIPEPVTGPRPNGVPIYFDVNAMKVGVVNG